MIEKLQEGGYDVCDCGDVEFPIVGPQDKFAPGNGNMKYLGPITSLNSELAVRVEASLRAGAVPLTLGGDHAVALGSISASGVVTMTLPLYG